MIHVYLAAPLEGSGDPQSNVNAAIDAAARLLDAGFAPYVPHLTWYMHQRQPRDREVWLQLDRAWLKRCDALIRLPGVSPGADEEWEIAGYRGIPRWTSIDDFLRDRIPQS